MTNKAKPVLEQSRFPKSKQYLWYLFYIHYQDKASDNLFDFLEFCARFQYPQYPFLKTLQRDAMKEIYGRVFDDSKARAKALFGGIGTDQAGG